jgi:hypothetical protein
MPPGSSGPRRLRRERTSDARCRRRHSAKPAQTEPCRWPAHCEPIHGRTTPDLPAVSDCIGPRLHKRACPGPTCCDRALRRYRDLAADVKRPDPTPRAGRPHQRLLRSTYSDPGRTRVCAKAGLCLSTSGESEGVSAGLAASRGPTTARPGWAPRRLRSRPATSAHASPSGLRRPLYPPDVDHPSAPRRRQLATEAARVRVEGARRAHHYP